ncbi:uroporphyrinogen-III C-methyltransferase [Candidatus Nitrotoga sp. M5]|uniref:uroporphyrinogen-III C-methyltransferase n=1 Tax=Candidatus Nitrotoga sp. M5 TaxID=2890409 RepID=UPI001EF300B6|nr:uroporphyrinogen-III C-methyltransferase [Candidatus Nitrotoga sp. M5]CAH1385515.1 Homolog of E. coli HemX protein [Candidatus Nitrotoga sp. M5]
MTKQEPPTEPVNLIKQEAAKAPADPPQNNAGNFISRISIMRIVLAAVLILFLWQWFDTHRRVNGMQQDLARRLAKMDDNNKANQLLTTQMRESMRELSAKVGVLETYAAEAQNHRAAQESLYQDLSGSRDETALAEVEQLLLIAGQQLQLSANVKTALIAMQQADDRLKRMDRAALKGLRKIINRDIDKLRTLPDVDVPDIKFRLDNLIADVGTLQLIQDNTHVPQEKNIATIAPVSNEAAWRRLLREVWEDMSRLVRIENTQKLELPLLPPTQAFFLRENLKLRLLSARLSLLSYDERSFKHDLQLAQEWIVRYFDVKSTSGALAVTTLQKLQESSINIELPDVSASLEAARNYRSSIGKGAR